MSSTTTGITFSETMEGGFALGEIDPKQGEQRGEKEETILTIHATVTIPDLQRFIDDPDHRGEMVGRIDFPPFDRDIPSTSGTFNLFSPTDDPKLKLMVYELGFEHAGKNYYLAGRKEVRQDPGFDLWKDTTTLFTLLHEGRDTTGKVVGAGIVSLGLDDMVKMVASMRVIGTDSPTAQLKTMIDFGHFFLGDLWDSYGRPIVEKMMR